jgi:hypothetical protein
MASGATREVAATANSLPSSRSCLYSPEERGGRPDALPSGVGAVFLRTSLDGETGYSSVGFGGPSAAPPVAEPRARTPAHSAVKGSLIDRVDDVAVRAICVMSMSARSAAGTRRWLE